MSRYKKNTITDKMNVLNALKSFFKHIYLSYIPNAKDNLTQILIKSLFLICTVSLILSSVFIADYFFQGSHQEEVVEKSREIWNDTQTLEESEQDDKTEQTEQTKPLTQDEKIQLLLAENSDFKGWITIKGTKVDNPIYQTTNNSFYLDHNQNKRKSVYGALFFDYENKITEEETDKNLVIFGHEMKNGSMFGQLKKYKTVAFYKEHPMFDFSTIYKSSKYKIYSVFLLNSKKDDDNGYIYNIYRNSFRDAADFDSWTREAFERSVIETNVDVEYGDNIVTLVTCSNDFKDARLIIMARELREGESAYVDTTKVKLNPNPRYPQIWYTERGFR